MTGPTAVANGGERTPAPAADVLALALGTTAAMWACGYVGHMPLTGAPIALFLALMLACLVAGGYLTARFTARGLRGAALVGVLTATVNLLILGSLGNWLEPRAGQMVPHALVWIPGWYALSVGLCVLAALAGRRKAPRAADLNWIAAFAWITAAAALLLIAAGGLVTGFRAGMAVPDWPNTFGSNLFLYPFSQMTGGVFYEHAHRLLGALVGLSTLVLAMYLWRMRPDRPALIALVWLVGLAVLAQGALGGFRVTDNSAILAVVHGFFAHAVLAGLVAVAVMLSRRFETRRGGDLRDNAATDHVLTVGLVGMVLLQTFLGAMLRQLNVGLLTHITVAVAVAVLALAVGVRAWGLNPAPGLTPLRRGGITLLAVLLLQVTLGILAVAFRTPPVGQSLTAEEFAAQGGRLAVSPVHALLTTAHQANAAVLLAAAVVLAVWSRRMLRQATQPARAAAPGPV